MSEHTRLQENASNDNLFEIFTAEVVNGELTELYLLAGKDFVASYETQGVQAAIAAAKASSNADAFQILCAHYQMGDAFGKSPMFVDGLRGVLSHNNVAVQFDVKEISRNPQTYRVLFQRVDAKQLLTEIKGKLDDLNDRVKTLEQRPRWNQNS